MGSVRVWPFARSWLRAGAWVCAPLAAGAPVWRTLLIASARVWPFARSSTRSITRPRTLAGQVHARAVLQAIGALGDDRVAGADAGQNDRATIVGWPRLDQAQLRCLVGQQHEDEVALGAVSHRRHGHGDRLGQ